MSESRGLASNTIDALADDLVITNAGEALAQGLIDGLIYEKGFENKIKAALEIDAAEEYKVMSFNNINVRIKEYNKEITDRIAIVYAQGPILYTEGSEEIIGKESINKAFEEILDSKKIKAVVLRLSLIHI